MNKILTLLLVALLISSASAQFLQNIFSGYANGQNKGEDHSNDSGKDSNEDHGEIDGQWNFVVHTDNGEIVDSGEFNGYFEEQDEGEFRVQVSFSRHQLVKESGDQFQQVDFSDKGEFTYIGAREEGSHGKITKDEVVPQIIKRLKQH